VNGAIRGSQRACVENENDGGGEHGQTEPRHARSVQPTEGDAAALLETSRYMVDGKLIPKPLTWAQVKGAFAQTAALDKAAYDKSGRKPDAAGFNDKNAQDLRGAPVWDAQSWAERT
jgi:hypothetical protein